MVGSRRVGVRWGARAVVLLLGCVWFAGCAGQSAEPEDPCPETCRKGLKCPGVAQQDCDQSCLGNDALAEVSKCRKEYEKSLKCLVDLKDVCTAPKDCAAEILAAQTCEGIYCNAHKSDEVCAYFTMK